MDLLELRTQLNAPSRRSQMDIHGDLTGGSVFIVFLFVYLGVVVAQLDTGTGASTCANTWARTDAASVLCGAWQMTLICGVSGGRRCIQRCA